VACKNRKEKKGSSVFTFYAHLEANPYVVYSEKNYTHYTIQFN